MTVKAILTVWRQILMWTSAHSCSTEKIQIKNRYQSQGAVTLLPGLINFSRIKVLKWPLVFLICPMSCLFSERGHSCGRSLILNWMASAAKIFWYLGLTKIFAFTRGHFLRLTIHGWQPHTGTDHSLGALFSPYIFNLLFVESVLSCGGLPVQWKGEKNPQSVHYEWN